MTTRDFIIEKIKEVAGTEIANIHPIEVNVRKVLTHPGGFNWDMIPPAPELSSPEGSHRAQVLQRAVEEVRSKFPRIDW